MWYLMEDLANQREREISARTRAPLFTRQLAAGKHDTARRNRSRSGSSRTDRGKRGRVPLPALSLGKWRHWAARPEQVHCTRAASITGAC
jgi:hypothetical protein